MKTALLYMALLIVVDFVLIIGVCFAAVAFIESEFVKRIQHKWNKLIDAFWSIVCRIKNALRKGIDNTIKELQKIVYDIKQSEWFDSFIRKSIAIGYFLIIAVVICAIFLFIMFLHWHYPAGIEDTNCQHTFGLFIWDFLTNNSLFISLLASFIGLYIVFYALRPRYSISDKLVQSNNGILRVQITNKFLFTKLTDIHVEMVFIKWNKQLQGDRTWDIPMNKTEVSVIHGLHKGKSKSAYIVHSESGFVWNDNYDAIRCRVIATHGISGIKRIEEKRFTKEQIIKGTFVGRQLVKEEYRYPMPNSPKWSEDIEKRCATLWKIADSVRKAITPIKIDAVNLRTIYNAIDNVNLLKEESIKALFPSIDNNEDTIENLLQLLDELDDFYFYKTNLNPTNKETRLSLFEKINKNITFLADQMAKDIEDYYSQRNNVNN